jgi:hypothetical protein
VAEEARQVLELRAARLLAAPGKDSAGVCRCHRGRWACSAWALCWVPLVPQPVHQQAQPQLWPRPLTADNRPEGSSPGGKNTVYEPQLSLVPYCNTKVRHISMRQQRPCPSCVIRGTGQLRIVRWLGRRRCKQLGSLWEHLWSPTLLYTPVPVAQHLWGPLQQPFHLQCTPGLIAQV